MIPPMIQSNNFSGLLKKTLIQAIVILGLLMVWIAPQILEQLWANPLGPWEDLVIYTLINLILLAGLFTAFSMDVVSVAVFVAGLAAMVQMYRAPGILIFGVAISFFRLTTPAINHLNKPRPIFVVPATKKSCFYPPLKHTPTSTLPYERYGVSCILLN